VRPTVQTQNKTCGSIQHTLKRINGRRGQTGENDVAIVETTQYKRRHQLIHGLLADLVAELPLSPEVVETSLSDLADVTLRRQFAVKPDPKITHNIGAVDGCSADRQDLQVGRDLRKAGT